MQFSEYQQLAQQTALYPRQHAITYPALGLAGEAGEVANKVKKILRDANGQLTEETRQKLLDELGDVLWYVAALCADLNADLDEVAQANIHKLFDRKARGVLGGSGDNR
jgi:NTP pyrophosphatase (non-canonical NTP hydrolase)